MIYKNWSLLVWSIQMCLTQCQILRSGQSSKFTPRSDHAIQTNCQKTKQNCSLKWTRQHPRELITFIWMQCFPRKKCFATDPSNFFSLIWLCCCICKLGWRHECMVTSPFTTISMIYWYRNSEIYRLCRLKQITFQFLCQSLGWVIKCLSTTALCEDEQIQLFGISLPACLNGQRGSMTYLCNVAAEQRMRLLEEFPLSFVLFSDIWFLF